MSLIEPLIDFLAFLVQKLWCKIDKLINWLIEFLFTLDHNFWTRNLSRSSKVSNDSDCSLVSNKNFSEILPSNSLEPGEVGQDGPKVLHLWCHSQKIRIFNKKIFFECRLEDLPHLLSFWTALYCFQRQSYACAKPCVIRLFWHKNPQNRLDAKVLRCWELVYIWYTCTWKSHVSHISYVTLHHHNSPADWARELFKPSKDAASLLVGIFKNWKVLDFCGWHHTWGRFRDF